MKKILSFFELAAYVLAVIGGVGYACYGKAYLIAVAIVVLGIIALPEVRKAWNILYE